jgi:hypothetical protein
LLHQLTTTDCAVCTEGYSSTIGYECTQCKSGNRARIYTGIAIVVVLFMIAVCIVVYATLNLGDGEDAGNILRDSDSISQGCNCRQMFAKFPWNKLRIPIVAFQIVTQYISITGLPLPEFYHKFLG